MSRISVLDCTLRDGGYCNGWKYGYENIKKIIFQHYINFFKNILKKDYFF